MVFLLHDLLRLSAATSPDKLAVLAPKESICYDDLDQRSDALAHALVEQGVTPGTPVGIAMHKCIDAIVGVYGILKAGACYVPIDVFAPAQRSASIVTNTGLEHLLTTHDRADTFVAEITRTPSSLRNLFTRERPEGKVPKGLTISGWTPQRAAPSIALPRITDSHLAYILHTSGSTGIPKGVAISHRNALCFVDSARAYWEVSSEDRLCSQAPLHFDLSVFDLYVAAAAAASIVLIPEFYGAFPKKMASAIDEYKISVWNSVVSTLTLMMQRGRPETASFESLRAVIFSGEVMPPRYLRLLHEHMQNASFYNVYGQTEANSSLVYAVQRDNLPEHDDWKVPLGKELPNFEVFALDTENRQITGNGQQGELYVRASTVAQGYWGQPALTSEKFVSDPRFFSAGGAQVYRTGDLVSLDSQGDYHFEGRTDDMVKSRGYRIELGEIEVALLSNCAVESATAVAIPDEEVGNRIYAFTTQVQAGPPLTPEAILIHCREFLPKYMVPEAVFVLGSLPRTSTNKVDRNALRKIAAESTETEQ